MGEFRVPPDNDNRVGRRSRGERAGPIGGLARRLTTSLTTFRQRDDGEWVFGPELSAEFRLVVRSFIRRDASRKSNERIVDYHRYEIAIGLSAAKNAQITKGATLMIADMPLGQRRFDVALIQNYGRSAEAIVLDDLIAELPESARPTKPELSDIEAIRFLHSLPVNHFASEHVLTAPIAATEVGQFVTYDDFEFDPLYISDAINESRMASRRMREEITARTRKDAYFAFGIVQDFEAIKADLYLHPNLRRAFDLCGEGKYKITIPGLGAQIPVPFELASRVPDHFNLAICQALAGAGSDCHSWEGQKVARLAMDYFDRHLCAAIKRFDGREIPKELLTHYEEEVV